MFATTSPLGGRSSCSASSSRASTLDAVVRRVLARHVDGDRVDVDGHDGAEPEARGRDREDTRAAADVEHVPRAGAASSSIQSASSDARRFRTRGRARSRPQAHRQAEAPRAARSRARRRGPGDGTRARRPPTRARPRPTSPPGTARGRPGLSRTVGVDGELELVARSISSNPPARGRASRARATLRLARAAPRTATRRMPQRSALFRRSEEPLVRHCAIRVVVGLCDRTPRAGVRCSAVSRRGTRTSTATSRSPRPRSWSDGIPRHGRRGPRRAAFRLRAPPRAPLGRRNRDGRRRARPRSSSAGATGGRRRRDRAPSSGRTRTVT